MPNLFPLALSAFGVAAVVVLGVLFGLGVFSLDARTLIPLAGLMIGNSMTATVLVARRVFEELRDKRDEVEARLALGQTSWDAAAPYVRNSLRTALIPQIETTKAVGLVFLPGAMTGLILAGVDPFDAVLVQAAVMYVVLGSVATTTTVVALGVRRRLFTRDHRLVRITRIGAGLAWPLPDLSGRRSRSRQRGPKVSKKTKKRGLAAWFALVAPRPEAHASWSSRDEPSAHDRSSGSEPEATRAARRRRRREREVRAG